MGVAAPNKNVVANPMATLFQSLRKNTSTTANAKNIIDKLRGIS